MRKMILIPGILILTVFSLGSVWAAPQTPPSAPVTVVNTQSNPVPVTGTVTVSNPPSETVTVGNTSEDPVPVTGTVEVLRSSITPVRHSATEFVMPGWKAARILSFYTVPDGKRLVVEHLSCDLFLYPPDSLSCSIEDMDYSLHSISPAYTPAGSAEPLMVRTGQAIKVIFGPGESFNAFASWGTATPGSPVMSFSFSGYLEDAP